MPQKNNFHLNDNNQIKSKFFKNVENNIVRFIYDNFNVDTYLFLIIFSKWKEKYQVGGYKETNIIILLNNNTISYVSENFKTIFSNYFDLTKETD